MAEEIKVKLERPETRPNVKPDTGRNGRGDNKNRNQRFRKTTEKFVRYTTENVFGRTKAIRGLILDSISFGQA